MATLIVSAFLATACLAAAAADRVAGVQAEAYILVDALTGEVIAEQQPDKLLLPASLAKMMTAYIVFESLHTGIIELDDPVVVSSDAAHSSGYRLGLQAGHEENIRDLLIGMLAFSGNDAAVVLAQRLAGSEKFFVEHMNARAAEIGMDGTRFANATGLPATGQKTTARDMELLARRTWRDFPDLYKLYGMREHEIAGQLLRNRNKLLGDYPGVDGLKTGSTRRAGNCLAISALHQASGMRLFGVLLKAPSEQAARRSMAALLDHGFTNYRSVELFAGPARPVDRIRVWGGASETVALRPGGNLPLRLLLPKEQAGKLRARLLPNEPPEAPVAAGERLAMLSVTAGDKVVALIPALAMEDVAVGPWWRRVTDYVRLHWLPSLTGPQREQTQ